MDATLAEPSGGDASRRGSRVFFWGCALAGVGCLTAIVAMGGLFFLGREALDRMGDAVRPEAERFLTAVGEGEFEAAWAGASEQWRAREDREAFEAWAVGLQTRLGEFRSLSIEAIEMQTQHRSGEAQRTTATLRGLAQFEREAVYLRIVLSGAGLELRVDRIEVERGAGR